MSTTTTPKLSARSRYFYSVKNYLKHFGELPSFIRHRRLASAEASALLDVACSIDTRLTPAHLAWWFAARERLGSK